MSELEMDHRKLEVDHRKLEVDHRKLEVDHRRLRDQVINSFFKDISNVK